MLNPEELLRYNRQIRLPEIGEAGQEKLKSSRVLVIGAGGLGCPVLQYLTAVGVGTIGIVDFDKVDESNLQRQILYSVDDVGKLKVDCAVHKLTRQNPHVRFITYNLQLTNQNAIDIIKNYDIIVDGTDNYATRYLLNDACVLLDKPWIYGSIHRFEAQISVFNYLNKNKIKGPTYRCLFPSPPLLELEDNCSEIGVLGVLPGIVGMLQANETIKIITEIGDILSGELLILNALNLQFHTIGIERSESSLQAVPSSEAQFTKTAYGQFCNTVTKELKHEVSIEELHRLMSENRENIQLVDVREQNESPQIEELKEINIPLVEIIDNAYNIDRNKKVIIFCKSGVRSAIAILLLQKKFGMKNLFTLKGGVNEWLRSGKNKV